MGISKWIMTNSPASIGSLVRNWSKIFLGNNPNESVDEAMYLTYYSFIKSGLVSGLIKTAPYDLEEDYELIKNSCDRCLSFFMLMLIKTSESMNQALKMGGETSIQALEVIYEQAYKIAPKYIKTPKNEFVSRGSYII